MLHYCINFVKIINKNKLLKFTKCLVKTAVFLFWATVYFFVMRFTFFKSGGGNSRSNVNPLYDNANETKLRHLWAKDFVEKSIPIEKALKNYTDKQHEALKEEFDRRNMLLSNTCKKYNLSEQHINSKEYFISYEYGLIWCNIFKAASSHWMYNFNRLGGRSEDFLSRSLKSPLILARSIYERPTDDELLHAFNTPGTFSFMTVREPFERLLSAYRDKLENFGHYFYKKISRTIIRRYRNMTNVVKKKKMSPTFQEFVMYLIDEYEKTNTTTLDEHWCPYYKFCTPCAVNFTVIAKVETFQRDNMYILRELGLESMLGRRAKKKVTRIKTIMNKSKDGKNTGNLIKQYYSQLNKELLIKLVDIYRIDFEMFGYDFMKYLNTADH